MLTFYRPQVFPLVNRGEVLWRFLGDLLLTGDSEVGMSLSCAVNFTLAGVLAATVPLLNHVLKETKLLCLFA